MNKQRIFWKEGFEGKATGGYYFRVFDLVEFINKLENKEGEVIGLEFEGNNVQAIINPKKNEDKLFDDLLNQYED